MLFKSKQTVNSAPVWELDTDTQTVRHRNPKTGKTERYVFHTELLMQSSRDYQAAVMSGRIDQSGAIGNLLRMQAQRAVYDTMIYLWRDE